MDSIADLLAKRQPPEPPEIKVIKQYVHEQFKEAVGVLVRERDIVITVRSSALAGALRVHTRRISEAIARADSTLDAATQDAPKRLIFRVASS